MAGMDVEGRELLARALGKAGLRFAVGREDGVLGKTLRLLREREGVKTITPLGDIAGAFMAYGNTYYQHYPAAVLCSTPAETVNAFTGLGTAWADKIPLLMVTVRSSRRLEMRLPGGTQGESYSAFTKWSSRVLGWEDIPLALGQALREALNGCHGPVHLDIDERVLLESRDMAEGELEALVEKGLGPLEVKAVEGDPELVEKGLKLLMESERPLIVSGGGVIHAQAWEEMDRLVRMLGVPATTTVAGEGGVLGDNPYYIGGPSYVGGEAFHRAIKRADCALVVGAALGGLEGFGQPPFWNPDIRFVQVDVDPVNMCLNIPVEVSILGDARAVLNQMIRLVEEGAVKPNPSHTGWLDHLQEVRRRWRARIEGEAHGNWPLIHQGFLARTIRETVPPGTFLVIDGGNTTLWAGMFCMEHKPKSALFPAGMGTLGCGIPVAMGIRAADPLRPLAVIQGDGSFLYNVQELENARRLGMDFLVVIFNDGCWNMIKGAQDLFFGSRRVGSILGDIDYAAVARGLGCYGRRVSRASDIAPALREAMQAGGPAVVDVLVDPDCFPETLASFALGEFEGVRVNPLRALGIPKMKIDWRLVNRAKYAVNIMFDRDLR
ncbi:thiamine pyrophosphate-binding protein [Candidatus Solincola tengchongensis]|uniref:thiamine pyrophosphate-binding protein n=1 Tax=Candidatus Solincola tengchongensis TaxID=2900693 RepID=UPI00257B8FF5|nr:thiamine pyrophosphate-binding protein [Candidatus Solincola tengchongensis]